MEVFNVRSVAAGFPGTPGFTAATAGAAAIRMKAIRGSGRGRHVYGIGGYLIETIKRDTLNLRAPPSAFGFYERLGFIRVEGRETVTHRLLPAKKKAAVAGRLQSPAFSLEKTSRDEG